MRYGPIAIKAKLADNMKYIDANTKMVSNGRGLGIPLVRAKGVRVES